MNGCAAQAQQGADAAQNMPSEVRKALVKERKALGFTVSLHRDSQVLENPSGSGLLINGFGHVHGQNAFGGSQAIALRPFFFVVGFDKEQEFAGI